LQNFLFQGQSLISNNLGSRQDSELKFGLEPYLKEERIFQGHSRLNQSDIVLPRPKQVYSNL